jgi:hypothetical protein
MQSLEALRGKKCLLSWKTFSLLRRKKVHRHHGDEERAEQEEE